MNKKEDLIKELKYSLIEDLDWFEEEFDALYLFKAKLDADDIKQAHIIIELLKKKMGVTFDKHLKVLLKGALRKAKGKYPEFFEGVL